MPPTLRWLDMLLNLLADIFRLERNGQTCAIFLPAPGLAGNRTRLLHPIRPLCWRWLSLRCRIWRVRGRWLFRSRRIGRRRGRCHRSSRTMSCRCAGWKLSRFRDGTGIFWSRIVVLIWLRCLCRCCETLARARYPFNPVGACIATRPPCVAWRDDFWKALIEILGAEFIRFLALLWGLALGESPQTFVVLAGIWCC